MPSLASAAFQALPGEGRRLIVVETTSDAVEDIVDVAIAPPPPTSITQRG